MATTQQTIEANLIALGFNNTSATAIYNKIAEAVGFTVDITNQEIANTEQVILDIINSQRYGRANYYTENALAFQYGDNLIVDPETFDYVYAVIDESKQIINQAAFEEIASGNSSQLFLKIATVDPLTGQLVALSTPQLNAFTSYFYVFQIPGLPISIISAAGNVINFTSICTYFATYDLATLQANLTTALNTFKNTFTFNGVFFDGDLEVYIKANVPGIRDFYIANTTIDGAPFGGSQSLPAGYFNYDASVFTNINYTAIQ